MSKYPPLKKRLARYNTYTARTVGLLVILSEAKNLVVAPARVCLIYPLYPLHASKILT